MKCHLQKIRQFENDKPPKFETVERFIESDRFDLYVCKCPECDQLYLACYREFSTWEYDDDWLYWVPITEDERLALRGDPEKDKMAMDLYTNRRHLLWHPDGMVYWSDFPPVGLVFPNG